MLASMIMFPMLERKWEKRQKEKYEIKRQKRYKEYIDSKVREIDKIMNTLDIQVTNNMNRTKENEKRKDFKN